MSSLAQYSPWHEAYAGAAGQRCRADKAAGKMQNAVGGSKYAVREK